MGANGRKPLRLDRWRSELKRELLFQAGKETEFIRQLKFIKKVRHTIQEWKKEATFDGLLLEALEAVDHYASAAEEFPQLMRHERRLKRRKGSRQLPSADFMALVVVALELSRGDKNLQFEIRSTLVASAKCIGIKASEDSVLQWIKGMDALQKLAMPTFVDVSFKEGEGATDWADKLKFRYSTYLAKHYKKSRPMRFKEELSRAMAVRIALEDWERKVT